MSPPAGAEGAGVPIGDADSANLGSVWRSSSGPVKALAPGAAGVPESGMDQPLQDAMDALYRDVVVLGDKARTWFDGPGLSWRGQLPIAEQAAVATESLATTARLMAVMAWLLDPAQAGGTAPTLRPLVIDAAADQPLPGVLAPVPGGEIALASRQLVARAESLARGSRA